MRSRVGKGRQMSHNDALTRRPARIVDWIIERLDQMQGLRKIDVFELPSGLVVSFILNERSARLAIELRRNFNVYKKRDSGDILYNTREWYDSDEWNQLVRLCAHQNVPPPRGYSVSMQDKEWVTSRGDETTFSIRRDDIVEINKRAKSLMEGFRKS